MSGEDEDALFMRAMRNMGLADKGRKTQGEDEDFEALMRGAEAPIAATRGRAAKRTTRAPATIADTPDFAEDDALFEAVMAGIGVPSEEVPTEKAEPEETPARVQGTKRRLSRGLRTGQIVAQATLDLHGMTRERAHTEVGQFIRVSQHTDRQVVRIVCGKGLHSKGDAVLRNALLPWLRRDYGEAIHEVVKAPPEMGGDGAFFVFLRRRTS
jgi:DNA-nicking Smr family endonuclease